MYPYIFSLSILLVLYLFLVNIYPLLFRGPVFSYFRIDCEGGNVSTEMAQNQLIWLIYSLFSEAITLKRAHVIMRISDRSLLVSVSVLISIFIFEFQSESSANVFPVSCFFCTVGFDVYETSKL